jgi:5-methylthioadenosine/S-adenosylhomocysteine deaminase
MRLFFNSAIYTSLFALLAWQHTPPPSSSKGTEQTQVPHRESIPRSGNVDWIINAHYVVTMDEHHRLIEQGAVAIAGSRIVGVGTQSEIASRFQAKHILEKPDALLAPGLIDTHTHAPMSLLRGLAEDKRLEDWLNNYIFPAESKNVTAAFVQDGTRLACVEMVLGGITTYTDMYYFEDAEAEAAKEVGVRGVLGQTVIGFPAPDYKTWQETITKAEQFIQHYAKDELITPAVAPHAIYSTPDEAIVAAHNLAMKYNVPMLIHLAEIASERDDALTKRNLTPVQVLDKLGVLEGRVLAAHAIYLDDNDIQILHKHNTGIAHCPSSNTKMAAGVAHVVDLLKAGLNVGLGTDGFAGSNDTADLFREMDLASKLQKVTLMDPTVMPAEQVFEMATIGGARALGLDQQIGSLEEGKRADIIAISLANSHDVPLAENIYALLVHAGQAADVEDVFINGKQIVSNRQVQTVNALSIYKKAKEDRAHLVMK